MRFVIVSAITAVAVWIVTLLPLDVVVVPYEPQLRPGGDWGPQRALVPVLEAWGVPTLDLADAFTEAGDPADLYLWSDGIPLSARGHAVAAAAVARWRPPRPPPPRCRGGRSRERGAPFS